MSEWQIADSSAWLEYLVGNPQGQLYVPVIEDWPRLIVPTICLYEVTKVILRERGAEEAYRARSAMESGILVNLDAVLALKAAQLSLPLADSIIYATTPDYDATLWTQDAHFAELPRVRYFEKVSAV